MELANQELTDIQRFYKNSTVFLTGATGFIGKLVLEKVLRALPVKKVYILVRKKKDVPPAKRCQDIFESPAYDLIKRTQPEVFQKVALMEGDCSLPMLGLSEKDIKTFIEEVDVIFHVAATVRFDDPLKKSVFTNVRCTKDLISLAKQIKKKIKTFVYVGTGYSNSNRTEIKEEIYPSKISAENLISACECLDDDCLKEVTKTLTKGWPNTYTFSKQVTEDYINREARGFPICIVRPTIVISTLTEPIVGFVDSVFTLAGFVLGVAMGLMRILYYKNIVLDIVPADFCVNQCIAAGWQTAESFKPYKSEVAVYNLSSCADNPITQDELIAYGVRYFKRYPSKHQIFHPFIIATSCKFNYLFGRIFLHTMMAHIVDTILKLQGKKPMLVAGMKKIHTFLESYEHFTTTQYFLHVENTRKILRKMSFKDRQLFNFDITSFTWKSYFTQYPRGLRVYVLKDPLTTLPEGRKHASKLFKVHIIGCFTMLVLIYFIGKVLLFRIIPLLFGLLLFLLRSLVC